MTKGFLHSAFEAARPDVEQTIRDQIERVVIGTNPRMSMADFSGEFVEAIAAIPPDQRDKVLVIGNHSGRDHPSTLFGTRGDRLIIDDPWADKGTLIDIDATRLFLDRLPALDGIDPVIVMSRLHDEPALKLAEAERLERRPQYAREYLAPAMQREPCNRAARRAQEARDRKARR